MKRFQDIHRYQYLGRKGYKLLVLWECDILGHPDETREVLRKYVNGLS
jgi:G:T-mismatch repair DNA endonuclease (very short patch repair protein)